MSVTTSVRPRVDASALVARAFAPCGAVQRVLHEHRREQAIGANDLIATLMAGRMPDGRPRLYVRQIGAGLGKTVMLLFVAAAYHLATGRRVVICTLERQLRADMLAELPRVNAVVQEALRDLDWPMPVPAIRAAEQKSKTGFASLRKGHALPRLLHSKTFSAAERQRLLRYGAWLDDTDTYELSEFVELAETLPLDCSEVDLGISAEDAGTPPYEQFLRNREDCEQADIVLATHAMVLRNNLGQGRVLDTARDGPRRFGALLIDEADSLSGAARSVRGADLTLGALDDELRRLAKDGSGRAAAVEVRRHLDRLSRFLGKRLAGTSHATIHDRDPGFATLLDHVAPLHDGCAVMRTQCMEGDDIITAERFQRAGEAFAQIRRWGAVLRRRPERAGHNVVVVREVLNGLAPGLHLGMRIAYPGFVVSPLWRPREDGHAPLHHFDTIAMVSATLRGSNDRRETFFGSIGINTARDRPLTDDDLIDRKFGSIRRLVYAARDPDLLPMRDADSGGGENPAHLAYVARAVALAFTEAAERPSHRILVLCVTVRSAMALHAELSKAGLGQHLFMPERRDPRMAASFAEKPHGIWLSWRWKGYNAVTDHTLIKTVVVTRLPIAPAVPRRWSAEGDEQERSWAIYNAVEDAFRDLSQGIARGVRRRDDEIDLWLMDPRLPLPDDLARVLGQPIWVAGVNRGVFGRFPDAIRIPLAAAPNSRAVLSADGELLYPPPPKGNLFARRFGHP